jgi:hypothetical protein
VAWAMARKETNSMGAQDFAKRWLWWLSIVAWRWPWRQRAWMGVSRSAPIPILSQPCEVILIRLTLKMRKLSLRR